MKNYLYLLGFTVFTAVFISCQEEVKKPRDNHGGHGDFEKHVKQHLIPVDQSIAMFREFESKRAKVVEPILRDIYKDSTFVDTKFVSFSLKEIKAYLKFIERIQEENPKQTVSGLRFYFAAYPNENTVGIAERAVKHPKQQTVFIAPTVDAGDIDKTYKSLNHLPFYIKGTKENPLKGDFIIIDELMVDYEKEKRLRVYNTQHNINKASFGLNMAVLGEDEITSPVYNEGEMVPPPVR